MNFELEHAKKLLHLQQANRTKLTIGVITTIIGFMVITQLRAQGRIDERLSLQTPAELGQIIGRLNQEKDGLQQEIAELRMRLLQYRSAEDNEKLILSEAAKRLTEMGKASGQSAIKGSGIQINLSDTGFVLADHDFVELINELRAAGAEAISVNDKTVKMDSYFTGNEGDLKMDGTNIKQPYSVKAIGSPNVLEEALNIPGGFKNTISSFPGVLFSIKRQSALLIKEVKE